MPSLFRLLFAGFLLANTLSPTCLAESDTTQIPELIRALENENVRYGASIALKNLGAKSVPALRKSLTAENNELRVWSAYTLGEIGPEAKLAVNDLKKTLTHFDSALRAASAQALGKIGQSAATAVEELANSLSDDNNQVRERSVVALGKIGPSAKSAVPNLIAILTDHRLRSRTRSALVQIGKPAIEPIIKSLRNDAVRFDLIMVLKQISLEKANELGIAKTSSTDITTLRLALFDDERELSERKAAADDLSELIEEAVPILIEAFENPKVSEFAAAAFSQVGPDAVPALLSCLSAENPIIRQSAADAIGHIGPTANAALPRLVELLKDKDRDTRLHAVLALHAFGKQAKPAVKPLGDVILDPKEREETRNWSIKTLLVTLPETHDAVVKILIEAADEKVNYGVRQLAKEQVRKIDSAAAKAAGVK